MATKLFIEVVENVLKPAVANKNFPSGSAESELLISGYQSPPEYLVRNSFQDRDVETLRLSLFFCNPVIDIEATQEYFIQYCQAYDKLKQNLPSEYIQSLNEGFFEVLGELSSHYKTFNEFYQICDIVKTLKNSNVNISSLLDSMYVHYSSMCMSAITEINENINNPEQIVNKVKGLLIAEINAIEIQLANENTTQRVVDVSLEFVETQIGYLKYAAKEGDLNPDRKHSQEVLGLISKFGELPDIHKQRFEEFLNLIGLINYEREERKEDSKELDLPNAVYSNSIPNIQFEEKNSIYSTQHPGFYVEVKKGRWNNKDIVIKRYASLDGYPWNPDKFNKEVQILQKCSLLAENRQPFLKCYGIHLYKDPETKKDTLTFLLEKLESDLHLRIEKLRSTNQNFAEPELKTIVSKLIGGFSLLEQLGIKHQDIKPQNILVNGSGNNIDVKIIDFSVSDFKLSGMVTTHTAMVMTTEMFKAPELVGQKQTTYNAFKADVYSLGLVFYKLYDVNLNLTGINSRDYQPTLLKDIQKVTYLWLKNLLSKMLLPSATRPTFKEITQYSPDLVTPV